MSSELDMKLVCAECGRDFIFSLEEQRYYMINGYSMPKRCPSCRGEKYRRMPEPEPEMATPLAEPYEEPYAEPIQAQPAPVVEPIREPEPIQPVQPVQPAQSEQPEVTHIPMNFGAPTEYEYYLTVDDMFVSIDYENKMVNIKKDKRDVFDSREKAEEWRSFLAENDVTAIIRQVPKQY